MLRLLLFSQAVSVTQHASYVELRHARIDASLYISVDARNGKYCIDDADLQGLNGEIGSVLLAVAARET